jgi:flagellar protein FlbD
LGPVGPLQTVPDGAGRARNQPVVSDTRHVRIRPSPTGVDRAQQDDHRRTFHHDDARALGEPHMIRLTRLRKNEPLYLNPDHIERLDQNHETVVHLANGNEYLVLESPDDIVELIVQLRGRVLAAAHRYEAEPLGLAPVTEVN